MHFKTKADILKALTTLRREKTGKNMHYPVLFKKALCEFIAKNKISIPELCGYLNISNPSIYAWVEQYNKGLYSLEGAYSVSTKSKKLNEAILKKLNQEVNELKCKIEIIKQATELGLTVS